MEGGDVANDPYWKEARDILDKIARGSASSKGASDLGQSVSKLRASIGGERVGPDDPIGHNDGMAEPLTRPELDAKLKTVELVLDRRIDGIEAKLDGLKGDVASTKSTVRWMAALIVGTVVATAGIVVTSFDSGRDTANMVSAAEKRIDATVSEAVERIEAAAARLEANRSGATP